MSDLPVISNASPLIALAQIDHLDLLKQLFQTIVIPPTVAEEVAPTVAIPDWIEQHPLSQPIDPRILQSSLGPGECETIGLALEIQARLVILDERPGRRLAQRLRLPIIGTLGMLLAGKRKGLLLTIKPLIDGLLACDFRVSADLYEQILLDADEAEPLTF